MSDFSKVQSLLQDAVGPVYPAAQLVVVDGAATVFDGAVGTADASRWFDVASLTKPLATTTLAMMLVESGQLSLATEARAGVTVRHLLEHASGLAAWKLIAPSAGAVDVRQGILDAVQREPLENAPGTVARYSDLGFILLGGFIERATGRSLDALFAERVAGPLGIDTCYRPADRARCLPTEGDRVGIVHDENARNLGGVAGHAGLFSNARDVSALVAALVAAYRGRTTLVQPETVKTFWTPSAVPGSTFCLGWDRPSAKDSSAGARWPRSGVGHLGFTGCSLWIDPGKARWVVLLTNRVHPTGANERIKAFRPLLHDAILEVLEPIG